MKLVAVAVQAAIALILLVAVAAGLLIEAGVKHYRQRSERT